jgi:hypothetical protein
MLADEAHRRRTQRGNLYLSEIITEAYKLLERGRYLDIIGHDHLFASQNEAIAKILPHVDRVKCRRCENPLFKACRAGTS